MEEQIGPLDIHGEVSDLVDDKHLVSDEHPKLVGQSVLAICGRKVFRHEIFGGLGGVFSADYKYYRKHGWYDFPHKQIGMRFGSALIRTAMRLLPVRKKLQDNIKDYMLLSYQKVLQ